jgi:REP element-mobilizing transposase RayT
MARPPRAFQAGIYHLGSHGSDDRYLFLSDSERELFLERLDEVLERFELGLLAYTLMGNHYHLLLRIEDARVSKAIQQLHTWYSRLHNKLNGQSAHLLRAHFFARELESSDDLLWAARYLAWNPVAAGIATHPFAWRWSSAASTAGLKRPRLRLELEPLQASFGSAPDWRTRYRAFIDEGNEVELAGLEPATSWVRFPRDPLSAPSMNRHMVWLRGIIEQPLRRASPPFATST